MKWILLLAIYVFNSSWISPGTDEAKGTLSATVEGRAFALADGQLMRGVLVKKDGSMDGRTPPRTIINANFTGPTYNNGTEKDFTETIEMEIEFENKGAYTPAYFSISLGNQSTSYFIVNEQSKMNVSNISWSSDKKSLRLFADFNCTLRSFGFPHDHKKDVNLKGKLSNIRVTVPSWIAAKL